MPVNTLPLLQQLTAERRWFRARKTRPIWIRRLDRAERVETLEGPEEVPAGAYLCRDEAGDIWPQSEQRIAAKYVLTDEINVDGWRKCAPRPDAAGVMAAQVPHAFQVQAK